ncbi:MAG: DUF6261 family protein, partial [Tannerella sp.]|nr:DUF6261 family protein [Tannerella sp.]
GSVLTELLAKADKRVDRDIVGINSVVNAGLHHFDEKTVAAANEIHGRMKAFGNIEGKSYDDEAAAVKILIRDLRTSYAVPVMTLGLGAWIDELDKAHVEFENLFVQRNAERAAKPDASSRSARKAVDNVFCQMTEIINASAVLDKTGAFVDFIAQLNGELKYAVEHTPHHARHDVAHVTVADIPTQPRTGKPVVVIPTVFFTVPGKPAVELVFTKDFTVTYRDNIEPGTATLVIHGKGAYKGTREITFQIKS